MKLHLKKQLISIVKNKKILLAVAGLAGIILISFLFLRGKQIYQLDSRTVKVQDTKNLKQQVQKDADDSMFTIRINSRIKLDSTNTQAPLYIRNSAENKYDTYIELISDKTQKTIYKSKILKPGESILQDSLQYIEEPGSHAYTACFHIMEGSEEISVIEYAVTIEVKGGNTDE